VVRGTGACFQTEGCCVHPSATPHPKTPALRPPATHPGPNVVLIALVRRASNPKSAGAPSSTRVGASRLALRCCLRVGCRTLTSLARRADGEAAAAATTSRVRWCCCSTCSAGADAGALLLLLLLKLHPHTFCSCACRQRNVLDAIASLLVRSRSSEADHLCVCRLELVAQLKPNTVAMSID